MDVNSAMDSKMFVEFVYPEVKELCIQFLTLTSGMLVFSITFAEKLVGLTFANPWQKFSLLSAWICLTLAFMITGISLAELFLAAGRARAGEPGWSDSMLAGGYGIFAAGGIFCIALTLLVISGAFAVFLKRAENRPEA